MWFALLASQNAHAQCSEPIDLETFRDLTEIPWVQAIDGQTETLRQQVFEAERAVGCLTQPLPPLDAARFHRNRAMASNLSGDEDGAIAAANAARRLAPDESAAWEIEVPVFGELASAQAMRGPIEEFSTSLAARVWSDGSPVAARTTGIPVIVQVFAPDGTTVGGAWIDSRSRMPDWVAYPPVDCSEASKIEFLIREVESAEAAFARLDVEGFESALQAIALALPCVEEEIRPSQASAIHRLEGIRLYTQGNVLGAVRSFQEAQLLDAAHIPSASLIPPGSTLAALWERAGQVGAPPWVDTQLPAETVVHVDGIPARQRPATLPCIIQIHALSGAMLWTRYVPATARIPSLAQFAAVAEEANVGRLPPALQLYRDDEVRRKGARRAGVLRLGGVGLLAGAGLLYAANVAHATEYQDIETPPERLPELRKAANRSANASSALVVVGAGLIGLSFVIR